jgi:hypothetical protein
MPRLTGAPGGGVLITDDRDTTVATFPLSGSGPVAGAGIAKSNVIQITPAQFNALAATPVTIVPAVAGKMIAPLRLVLGFTVSVVYSNNPSPQVTMGSDTMPISGTLVLGFLGPNGYINAVSGGFGYLAANVGAPAQLKLSTAPLAGTVSTVTCSVEYVEI